MTDRHDVWAFSEKPALLAELLAGARSLAEHTGGDVTALVLGPRAEAEEALAQGAERVIWLGAIRPGALVEDFVPTVARLLEENRPYGMLIGSTRRGRAVAGRLAARLGVTALTDVSEFTFQGEDLRARHLIFGGGAVRVDQPVSETAPRVATVAAGVFEPRAPDAGRKGEIVEATPWVEPEWRLTLRQRKPRPATTVNLAAAKKIVCAGRGVAKQEDLSLLQELAQALHAELACTRPLAEGLGWLPEERYIGISGATVKPDIYLGVGVSGQVQHTIGMSASRLVVAINKDRSAPIFAQADYGIVGDLYAVVPALLQALSDMSGGPHMKHLESARQRKNARG